MEGGKGCGLDIEIGSWSWDRSNSKSTEILESVCKMCEFGGLR